MQFNSSDSGSSLQSEINITPLVDVVLVLLIIFMVVVPLLIEGYDVDIPRASADTSAQVAESQLILSIGSAACPILTPPEGDGIPKDCQVTLADQKIPVAELPARVASILGGRPAEQRALFLAVDDRICRDQLRWLLGDNHGSKEHFQNIRGSDGPQHGEEPGDPCLRAGRADGHTGSSAVSQRPQQRTRHRLLSSAGDRGQLASRFASDAARDE